MANGKIVADTLEHSTAGSVTTDYVVNGSAKAWTNINQEAATQLARESFNISSIADGGTAKTTVNISNSMSNGNYSFVFGVCNGGGFDDTATLNVSNTEVPTASVFKFYSFMNSSLNDALIGNVNIHGDLA